MPTYEYECPICGVFEAEHKISDKPLKFKPGCDDKRCPKKAIRLVSGASFVLAGGGWYKDGYASSSPAKSESINKSNSDKLNSDKSNSDSSIATTSTTGGDSGKKSPDATAKPKKCGSGCGCH
jgi:putative FmdB family regulatory protein